MMNYSKNVQAEADKLTSIPGDLAHITTLLSKYSPQSICAVVNQTANKGNQLKAR